MLEKLTNTQKLIGLLLVVLVLYILYMMYKTCKDNENFASEMNKQTNNVSNRTQSVRVMNTPHVKLDADSYHQPEQKPQNTYVDKHRCLVTSGSEFIGLPHKIDGPSDGDARSDFAEIHGVDGIDVNNTSANGLGYNPISRGTRCGSAQYPPPFKTTTKEDDDRMKNDDTEYVPSSYTGSNGLSDSGNICITPEQRDHISGRGGNAACADYKKHFVKYDAAGCPA